MPTAPFTLAQLLTPATLPETKVKFLALLQAQGFPAITEWAGEPTGTEMTFVEMLSRALDVLTGAGAPTEQQLASVAAGNYRAWAKGRWLDLLLEQFYLLTRGVTTKTSFQMTLVSDPNAPAYQFQVNNGVGDVWLVGPTGKRYNSTTAGDLSPGGAVEVAFAAENFGSSYTDDPSLVTLQLATPFAGVSLVAGGGDFSIVTTSGSSTGRLQPRRTDSFVTPLPHTFAIQVLTPGEPGSATWALQVDDDPFVPQGILQPTNVLVDGTSVTAIAGSAPSFVEGDIFVFSTPGTPNYVQGDDAESDEDAAARAGYRWPAQSRNVMDGKVKLWALKAYPAINRIQVSPDNVTPGRFIVTAADSHGSVDQAVLDTIEAFIKPRLSEGEDMGAATPSNLFVYARGNVKVPSATSAVDLEDIQAAADDAWRAYVSSVDIGPSEVRLSRLTEILIDAGAVDAGDVDPLVLNAGGIDWPINVAVLTGQVPTLGDLLSRTLTWGFV